MDFPGGSDSKESACNTGDLGLIPEVGKIPWRKAWQPTPLFLPGESRRQRSLTGYSPRGRKEMDTTESLLKDIEGWGFWLTLSELETSPLYKEDFNRFAGLICYRHKCCILFPVFSVSVNGITILGAEAPSTFPFPHS